MDRRAGCRPVERRQVDVRRDGLLHHVPRHVARPDLVAVADAVANGLVGEARALASVDDGLLSAVDARCALELDEHGIRRALPDDLRDALLNLGLRHRKLRRGRVVLEGLARLGCVPGGVAARADNRRLRAIGADVAGRGRAGRDPGGGVCAGEADRERLPVPALPSGFRSGDAVTAGGVASYLKPTLARCARVAGDIGAGARQRGRRAVASGVGRALHAAMPESRPSANAPDRLVVPAARVGRTRGVRAADSAVAVGRFSVWSSVRLAPAPPYETVHVTAALTGCRHRPESRIHSRGRTLPARDVHVIVTFSYASSNTSLAGLSNGSVCGP